MNLNEQTNRIKQMMGLSESVSDIKGTLSVGSKGLEVEELQKILGINPKDGKFGPQTYNCVTDFQRKMKIEDDGIVGNNTKTYLDKLENGEVEWEVPEFCKTPQSKTQSNGQTSPQSYSISDIKLGPGDIIFMAGITTQIPFKSQVSKIQSVFPDRKVLPFRYTDVQKIKDAIKSNKGANVVLFSKGCEHAGEISNVMPDKTKLFIVEPWAVNGNSSVVSAVNNGVPNQNVIASANDSKRGAGVVPGSTPSKGYAHLDSLGTLSNMA